MKTGKPPLNTIKLLENISLGSAVFAVVLCVLIIVNFIQVRRADPLNSPAMTVLVEKLQNDPSNDQLRQEIRTLDLIARKAFFTAQWQVRTGGYLLFISILVLVSCIKAIELIRSKLPEEPAAKPLMFWETRILKRHWLVYSGIALVVLTLLLAWLTHNDLGKDLRNAGSGERGAGSGERGAGSRERGAGSRERGAGSGEREFGNRDQRYCRHQSPVTSHQSRFGNRLPFLERSNGQLPFVQGTRRNRSYRANGHSYQLGRKKREECEVENPHPAAGL